MCPTSLERAVLSLAIIVFVQVIAIVDFHVDDDPDSDVQVCCMVEHTFPQEPYRACHEKFTNSDTDNQTIICIHKCYYEAIGIFSADGNVQSANYFQYRDQLEPPVRDSFSYSLVYCAHVISELAKKRMAAWSEMRCNPVPFLFNLCLQEVGMANCPPTLWINSTLCDKYLKRLKQKYGIRVQQNATEAKAEQG